MRAKSFVRGLKRVGAGAAKTGLYSLKGLKSYETGDLYGMNQAALGVAGSVLGKKNFLQKGEDALDKRLSKSKAYRLAKNSFMTYHDAATGNLTGSYTEGLKVAKDVIGSKAYDKSLGKVDSAVQKYVMPSAQLIQDTYRAGSALSNPIYSSSDSNLKNADRAYSAYTKVDAVKTSANNYKSRPSIFKTQRPQSGLVIKK